MKINESQGYINIHDYPSHGKGGYYRDLEIKFFSFKNDKDLLISCLKNEKFLQKFNKQTNSEINIEMNIDILKYIKEVSLDEDDFGDATSMSLTGIFNNNKFDIEIFNGYGYGDCEIIFKSVCLSENIIKYII